jgi:hypothetical protein
MGIDPTHLRYAGRDGVAPKVSDARTAKPSIVLLVNAGKSMGELGAKAKTLPSESRVSIVAEVLLGRK